MEILFFNRSFYPDIEATGQLLTELCEELTKHGHNITVIAGKPYYHNQNNSFFFLRTEIYKDITIIRTGGTTLSKESLFKRIINLFFYFLFAFCGGFTLKKRPDIVISLTDPPVISLLGILFSKIYKAKFIYYCNDIYPDIGIITGKLKNPFLNFLLQKSNMLSFTLADKIICIGESMKKRIIQKGIREDKISVIHNWVDTEKIYEVKKEDNSFINEYKLENKFIVMYSGNLGLTQNLEELLKVVQYFQNRTDIKFLFIGEGAYKKRLMTFAQNSNLTNLDFLPYQPKEKLKFSLSAANIHLVPFQKGLTGVLVPSKIYGILACGKPFVAWVDKESEIYEIAHDFKCGITVPPGDIRNTVRAINWALTHRELLKEMGERGKKVVKKHFDKEISTNGFIKELEKISKN